MLACASALMLLSFSPSAAQGPAPGAPAAPAPPEEGDRPLAEDESMVLNFERADIREVIHSLATALGISYTIDPRVTGEVTIRTTGRIARDDLFPLFNQILRNNGIAAVESNGVYQMLPVGEALTRAIVPRSASSRASAEARDGFVIEIFALRHVAAEEMQTVLQPFVTPGGNLFSYPRANTLVVTDLESNVDRLRELAAGFDIDGFSNLHARVFKVEEGDPEELTNEILTLLTPYGVAADGTGEAGLSMVPLSRLDAIVAFAIDPTAFSEIERWIKVLDLPPDKTSGRQTFVYHVENAKAADLAAVLNELFAESGGGGGGGGFRPGAGAAPAGIGLFGAGGSAGGGRGAAGRAGRNRNQGGNPAGTAFGTTRGADGGGSEFGSGGVTRQATGLGGGGTGGLGGAGGAGGFGGAGGGTGSGSRRGGLGGAGGAGGGIGGGGQAGQAGGGVQALTLPGGFAEGSTRPIFRKEVRIVADEVTNSLVTLATRRDYQLVLEVLQRIDVVPRQVVLEVMIAEIQLNKSLEFGVRYAFAQGPLVESDTKNPDSRDSIFANQPAGRDTAGFLGDAVRFPSGQAFAVITDRQHFNIFLNAVQSRTNVKMLSAPHVIAADNREAHILVGQQIPILTSTATAVTTGTAGTTINSVQYRDTGKILTILPQVNSKGLVNLQLRQEVSAVGSESFGSTNSPSFTTREVETTMVVNDGATVVIGGIIDDQINHDRTGVPFLMDIPVLGFIFRDDTRSVQRTELIVTITPYVIRNRDEAQIVTDEFSARIEGVTRLRQAMKRIRTDVGRDRAAEAADDATPYPDPSQTFDEAPFDAP